jgi:FkbM family methyltransferase
LRNLLAILFRYFFKIDYNKKYYFGFYQKIFSPFNLFKGIEKEIFYKNFTLRLNLNDWIQQQIYFLGEYEKHEIEFILKNLKKGDVFIDIGANIGLFTLNASKIVGETGKVISFEAFYSNFLKLKKHKEINHLRNVQLEHLAISDTEKTLRIYLNNQEQNSGIASSYLENFDIIENVKSTSLDHYAQEKFLEKISFIKIDIEGGEYDALLGMKNVLTQFKPILLVEINHETLSKINKSEKDLINLLENLHYKLTMKLTQNENNYNGVFEPNFN